MFSRARTNAAQQVGGRRVQRADPDQLVDREQPREAADRHRRPAQRQRRDDHVHALAGGQAGVDHRAGLVHAPVDVRDDAVDRLEELRLVGERDVGALDPAVALDVDLVGPVDHDLGHRVVGQQRLEHAQADGLVDHAADQPRALGGREHRALARDHAADHALQARAALLLGEDRDLVEVDLLEQPPPVVADAVGEPSSPRTRSATMRSRRPTCRLEVSHCASTRRRSSPRPGTTIGIAHADLRRLPAMLTFMPSRRPRGRALRAAFSALPPRASTRLAVRAAFAAWSTAHAASMQLPDHAARQQQPPEHADELGRRLPALLVSSRAASVPVPVLAVVALVRRRRPGGRTGRRPRARCRRSSRSSAAT